MSRRAVALLAASLVWPLAAAAQAPASPASTTTLERITARGFLRCGSVRRPGLAMTDGRDWSGLEVEICRAVAIAALGEAGRYAYHDYGSAEAFDAVRGGEDDVSFLTFAEMAEQALTDRVLPGPPVFVESLDMMVAEASPARHFGAMAGKGICFMIGTPAEDKLEAWFHDHRRNSSPTPSRKRARSSTPTPSRNAPRSSTRRRRSPKPGATPAPTIWPAASSPTTWPRIRSWRRRRSRPTRDGRRSSPGRSRRSSTPMPPRATDTPVASPR